MSAVDDIRPEVSALHTELVRYGLDRYQHVYGQR
jgi:hypothetical protein